MRLPFPIQFMGVKWLLEVGFNKYLAFEKSTLRSWLIDWETRLIEENLPVQGEEEQSKGKEVEEVVTQEEEDEEESDVTNDNDSEESGNETASGVEEKEGLNDDEE